MSGTLARRESRGHLGPIADRVQVAVVTRPLDCLRLGGEGAEERVRRAVEVAGERAVAGEVVEDGRMLRVLDERLLDDRRRTGRVAGVRKRLRCEVDSQGDTR